MGLIDLLIIGHHRRPLESIAQVDMLRGEASPSQVGFVVVLVTRAPAGEECLWRYFFLRKSI